MIGIIALLLIVGLPILVMSRMGHQKKQGCGCGCDTCGNRAFCHRHKGEGSKR